jgi:hypothetical protein
MTKVGNFYSRKKLIYLNQKFDLLFGGLQRTSKLQEKPSAQKSKQFLDIFLIIFALQNPDPANQNQFGETLLKLKGEPIFI